MKKILFLLLIAATLLSGCVTATRTSIKNDGILQNFAYVVGRCESGSVTFYHASIPVNSYNPGKYFSLPGGNYELVKTAPGRYRAISIHQRHGTLSSDGAPLLTINVEPGKITYIGDINVTVSGAAPDFPSGLNLYAGVKQSVTSTKNVRDNSEEVKNALRATYPELAGDLNAIFVYNPAW